MDRGDVSHVSGWSESAGSIVVSTAMRSLRRELRALAWMVLEELASDAVTEAGRLVARTSARQIAARLALDPGTAAGALKLLRDRDLVALERQAGAAGRFGLAVYVLRELDGLSVVAPRGVSPVMAEPCTGLPCVAGPDKETPDMAARRAAPARTPSPVGAGRRSGRRPPTGN